MGTGNPFNSENQGSIDRTAVAAGSPATEMGAATSKLQDDARQDTVTKIKQVATDLVGNIAAGTAGACAFSLLAAEGPWGKALSVPLSFVAGGLTNYGVKDGLEHLLLPEQSRTLKTSDLIFGGFAGIAGVTAAAADGSVSATLARSIGRHQIGENVTAAAAQSAGRSLIEGNALTALKFNALRGITAGGIGSFTYSLPYEAYANWNQLQENPAAGISHLLSATAFDTAVGAATGGILGAGSTALARSPELIGRATARLGGDGGVLKVREFSVNDVHSNLENWPKLATAVEARSAKATADGVYSEFNAAGDTSSGHVNYSFTNHGQVENENLANMGLKNIIPGNHDYDAPGGKFHPERYPGIMAPILEQHPNMSLLNANLDLSAYPEYQRLVKPYSIQEVEGPDGPVKVATIGLTTEEGAVAGIKYNDHIQTAINTIKELNGQGITHIKLLTHLGMDEDQKLARAILDNDLIVGKITGGHTHDLTPTPIWVSNKSSLAAKLKFWKPTVEIPITQAGNGARYLGETEIAFKPNGAADRFRTTGRVIPLSDVEPNAAMQSSIAAQTADIENLKAESFNATATSAYSSENVRNRETALGNLMADAILSGTKKAFPDDAPQIALVHSGGIREGLPAGRDINRLDIANTVMNAGHKSEEQTELAMVDLTGKQIQGALEYGLRDIPAPPAQTIGQRLANLFTGVPEEHYDQPGNYVQVSGLKYSYDLARNPWEPGRVTNVTVRGADGNYTPIQPESSYRVVTRFHPIDKYTKFGLLGEGTPDQVQAALNLKAVPLSQVDLIGDYISGKTIDPSTFSAPDGRITDLTRRAAVGGITPTPFVAGQATGRENAEQRK